MGSNEDDVPMLGISAPERKQKTATLTLMILVGINLLNYIDRYTIAGEFQNMNLNERKAKRLLTDFQIVKPTPPFPLGLDRKLISFFHPLFRKVFSPCCRTKKIVASVRI